MHLSAGFVGVCFRQRLAASRNESQYECRWSTFYWPRATVPSTVVNGTPGRAPQSLPPKSPSTPPAFFPGLAFPGRPRRLTGVPSRRRCGASCPSRTPSPATRSRP